MTQHPVHKQRKLGRINQLAAKSRIEAEAEAVTNHTEAASEADARGYNHLRPFEAAFGMAVVAPQQCLHTGARLHTVETAVGSLHWMAENMVHMLKDPNNLKKHSLGTKKEQLWKHLRMVCCKGLWH